MLSGELPWLEATEKNEHYQKWIRGRYSLHLNPWLKIDTITIALLKTIFESDPSKRARFDRIRSHRAYINLKNLIDYDKDSGRKSSLYKRHVPSVDSFASQPQPKLVASQAMMTCQKDDDCDRENMTDETDYDYCGNSWTSFSQPNRIQDMFLSTQTQMELGGGTSQGITPPEMTIYFRVVRRMTRFMSMKNFSATIKALERAFDDLQWSWKRQMIGQYKIQIICNRRNQIPLIFRSTVNDMSKGKILVDFRLAKGDGIEFKRQFLAIKNLLKPIIQSYGHNVLQEDILNDDSNLD
mgnify:CR=1 FL=1